jgi:hypothetical protein
MILYPDSTKEYPYAKGLLMVLRQMTGHVLLIRPAIFKYLTDRDMETICATIRSNSITALPEATHALIGQNIKAESAELVVPNLDLHAEDYITALRKLQKSTTRVICKERTQDIRWAECYHAYCKSCLEEEMHHDAEQGFNKPRCKPCGLPMGQLTDKAEDAEEETPRWLNENGEVIHSTKSSVVVELLESLRDSSTGDPQAKVVVFTTFKDSHKFLEAIFEEEQWEFTVLTSSMSHAEREQSVDDFMEDPDKFIMLATNGVGGVGLNLTVATYVPQNIIVGIYTDLTADISSIMIIISMTRRRSKPVAESIVSVKRSERQWFRLRLQERLMNTSGISSVERPRTSMPS